METTTSRSCTPRTCTRTTGPRETVRWPARWLCDEQLASAEIKDVSPTGMFLRSADADRLSVRMGSRVDVDFATPGRSRPITVRGTVRWIGFSLAHDCDGFGIELDEASTELDAFVNRWME